MEFFYLFFPVHSSAYRAMRGSTLLETAAENGECLVAPLNGCRPG